MDSARWSILVACVVDVVFGIDVIAGSAEQVHPPQKKADCIIKLNT